jgi:hypothetical protein
LEVTLSLLCKRDDALRKRSGGSIRALNAQLSQRIPEGADENFNVFWAERGLIEQVTDGHGVRSQVIELGAFTGHMRRTR